MVRWLLAIGFILKSGADLENVQFVRIWLNAHQTMLCKDTSGIKDLFLAQNDKKDCYSSTTAVSLYYTMQWLTVN
jgi:hypothetical protein